jgi:hypothetical protein
MAVVEETDAIYLVRVQAAPGWETDGREGLLIENSGAAEESIILETNWRPLRQGPAGSHRSPGGRKGVGEKVGRSGVVTGSVNEEQM